MFGQIIRILGLLIGLLIFHCNNCCCDPKDTTVYVTVDSVPQFIYKDCIDTKECVDSFISEHLIWPSDDDIIARIWVQCIVEKDGLLNSFKIIRGLEERFDKASIDVIKLMPKWKPD